MTACQRGGRLPSEPISSVPSSQHASRVGQAGIKREVGAVELEAWGCGEHHVALVLVEAVGAVVVGEVVASVGTARRGAVGQPCDEEC